MSGRTSKHHKRRKGCGASFSLVSRGQLQRVLANLLDESEFLSPMAFEDLEVPQRQSYVLHAMR